MCAKRKYALLKLKILNKVCKLNEMPDFYFSSYISLILAFSFGHFCRLLCKVILTFSLLLSPSFSLSFFISLGLYRISFYSCLLSSFLPFLSPFLSFFLLFSKFFLLLFLSFSPFSSFPFLPSSFFSSFLFPPI